MKRKAVSLVLALTMVASVVAGCGSKQEAATTEPAAEETTEAAEDTTAADTAERQLEMLIWQTKKLVYVFISSLITS